MSLTQEFNAWQDGYTEKILRWVPHYEQLLGSVADCLPPGFAPKRILDLGCGNGNGTALLMSRFPDAQFTLLDASDEMIAACRERFLDRPDTNYLQCFFQEADFPAASFDLVVAVLALHHLPGPEKQALFPRICHWLMPGGILTYSDLFADKTAPDYAHTVIASWQDWALSHGTPESEWECLMDHHSKYDFPDALDEQENWLKNAGFATVQTVWQGGYWANVQAGVGE